MNIKRIIEACRLSDQEAMDLFHVDKKGLEDLIAGKTSLNMEGAVAVSKKFNLSLDYIIKGVSKGGEEKWLEDHLNNYDRMNTYKETDAKVRKLLKDNGFDLDEKTLESFYDKERGCVVLDPLISLDNAKLYFLLRDNKVGVINFGRGNGLARKARTWEEGDKAVYEYFLSGDLKDPGWTAFGMNSLDKNGAQRYLNDIRTGRKPFDPAIILKLLEKGAIVTHDIGASEYPSRDECCEDYIETALLKDYCERLLKK